MEGIDLGCVGTRVDGLFILYILKVWEYVALRIEMGHFAVCSARRAGERP